MSAILIAAAAVAASSPAGSWITEDRSAVVRIDACGQSICGSVSKILATQPNVPTTDIHNPNAALRSRPLIGLPILGGFTWSGSQWAGGRIYDPQSGKTYRSKVSLGADGNLKVSGCILFVCQAQRWTPAR